MRPPRRRPPRLSQRCADSTLDSTLCSDACIARHVPAYVGVDVARLAPTGRCASATNGHKLGSRRGPRGEVCARRRQAKGADAACVSDITFRTFSTSILAFADRARLRPRVALLHRRRGRGVPGRLGGEALGKHCFRVSARVLFHFRCRNDSVGRLPCAMLSGEGLFALVRRRGERVVREREGGRLPSHGFHAAICAMRLSSSFAAITIYESREVRDPSW